MVVVDFTGTEGHHNKLIVSLKNWFIASTLTY